MSHFLGDNSGVDQEQVAQANRVLNDLAKIWGWPIAGVFLFRLLAFILNAGILIIIAHLIALLVIHGQTAAYAEPLSGLILLMLLKTVSNYWSDMKAVKLASKIAGALRITLFNEIAELLSLEGQVIKKGVIISSLAEKAETVSPYFTRYLPQLWLSVAAPILVIIYVSSLNLVCGFFMLFTLPLIPVYMIVAGKGTSSVAKEQWANLSKMGGYFYDRLKGVTTLFVYGRLKEETELVKAASESYSKSVLKVLKIAFLSSGILDLFSTIIVAGVAIYIGLSLIGYFDLGVISKFSFTQSLTILMLVPDFLSALKKLGTYYHDRSLAAGVIMDFQQDGFQLRPESFLQNSPAENYPAIHSSPDQQPAKIELEECAYAYDERQNVFSGLNLTIEPGDKVILTGRNGAGKSTLFSLILGFISPKNGCVRIDGKQADQMSETEISHEIAWLSQYPKIFFGTLRENILVDSIETDDTILKTIEQYFDVSTFLSPFSNGLDTQIADDGRSVSGGERQKIALLRVLLKKSGIILLDEPYTNLDKDTIKKFKKALLTNKSNQTIIMNLHESDLSHDDFTYIRINESMEELNNVL